MSPGIKTLRRVWKLAAAAMIVAAVVLSRADPLGAAPDTLSPIRAERRGVVIEFDAVPVGKPDPKRLVAGDDVDVTFKLTDAQSGQPLAGRRPGAWLDLGAPGLAPERRSCSEKVDAYLGGTTVSRPMIDLTSYYILAFNRDASISVIDPLVGIAGRTNLLATIALAGPPGDWARSPDGARLFVTLPTVGQLAVIDATSFKVIDNIDVGPRPMRIAFAPNGGRLWLANDADTDEAGGVTAVDVAMLKVVGRIATGKGHHEIAFSEAGDYLFATNRESGDVSVVDAARLAPLKRLKTGPMPISLAYSKMAQALYVADGLDGTLSVIDGRDPRIVARVTARPGLGPLALTPDEQWAMVLNSRENVIHLVEVATNRLKRDIAVASRPYQILFSDSFAYIRSLDSELVSMISLKALRQTDSIQVSTFAAGAAAPNDAPNLGVSASIARAIGEAAVVVANPADNLIYYYMEGMLAPSGSFRNPGHFVGAVGVIDHGLKETQRGIYTARAKLPTDGAYNVSFLLDSPKIVECFQMSVASSAEVVSGPAVRIDYIGESDARIAGPQTVRFRLSDPRSGQPISGLSGVKLLAVAAAGGRRAETAARATANGVYEAQLTLGSGGTYYTFVGVPSLKVNYGDLPAGNLRASAATQ